MAGTIRLDVHASEHETKKNSPQTEIMYRRYNIETPRHASQRSQGEFEKENGMRPGSSAAVCPPRGGLQRKVRALLKRNSALER